MNCLLRRRARAFSLTELMIAMVVGAILAAVAFGMIDAVQKGARRVSLRLALTEDGDVAIAAIERELEFMVPLGVPGLDYARETFDTGLVRFFSSRDLERGGTLSLVEIRLDESLGNATSQGDDETGARLLLVRSSIEGVAVGQPIVLHAFRRTSGVGMQFTPQPVTPGARPAAIGIEIGIAPPASAVGVPVMNAQALWAPGAGMEVAP